MVTKLSSESYIDQRQQLTDGVIETLITMLELERPAKEIGLDNPLFGTGLGLDSVDAVTIAAGIEIHFDIEVRDTDIQAFRSINTIVDFIMQKRGELEATTLPTADDLSELLNSARQFGDYVAARNAIGVLDYSGDLRIEVGGDACEAFADTLVAGNVADIVVNGMIQSVALSEDGHIDAIVLIARHESSYIFHVDASRRDEFMHAIDRIRDDFEVSIRDISEENGIISVFGPNAQEFMVDFFDEDVLRLGYGEFSGWVRDNMDLTISRFGETGEFDYRISVPLIRKERFLEDLQIAGKLHGMRVLQADVLKTLYMEMKSIHQPTMLISQFFPSELDLQWMVCSTKSNFVGRNGLLQSLEDFDRRCVVLVSEQPVDAKEPDEVWCNRRRVGIVHAYGGYSPVLRAHLAMALIDRQYAWPNLSMIAKSERGQIDVVSRSAPLFLTRTVLQSLNI